MCSAKNTANVSKNNLKYLIGTYLDYTHIVFKLCRSKIVTNKMAVVSEGEPSSN